MKLALISPWGTICGVSEMAHFLVQALEARGHQFTIFANQFAGEYQSAGIRLDTVHTHRIFGTGFAPEGLDFDPTKYNREFDLKRFAEIFTAERPDVVLLNYQDFLYPDKKRLNGALQLARDCGTKTVLLLHDDCVSRDLATGVFDHIVCPPSIEFLRAVTIDQGIPEFGEMVPAAPDSYWWISCFGLGRNKTAALQAVVREINEGRLLRYPLKLQISAAKPLDLTEDDYTTILPGYVPERVLASRLHASHACVIWYPDLAGRSTSSAFRFAVGSKVPIICNRSNWVADQLGNGCWVEVPDGSPEAMRDAIIRTFQTRSYDLLRERMTRMQEKAIQRAGWSEIARQYEGLLQGTMTSNPSDVVRSFPV